MYRRYQKVQEFLPQIKQMLEQGMSQREVAESIGLKGERPAPARDAGGAAQRGAGPFEGWYKALEDRIWLTQLGLNILLPLVLCLGAAGGPVWILTAALPAAPAL